MDADTFIDIMSFYFQFEEFLSNLTLSTVFELSTVFLTYHPFLISKICPKFQVLSSHFSNVDQLLVVCSISIDQNLCTVKIFLPQSMSHHLRCKKMYLFNVCCQEFGHVCQEFGHVVSDLMINLSNPRMTILHVKIGSRLRDMTILFFFGRSI